MRITVAIMAAAIIIVPALAISPALTPSALAAPGPKTTPLPAYNGSESGPRITSGSGPIFFRAIGPAINRAELGAGGYLTFTTTVANNAFAAQWSTNGMLELAGFLRVIPGETPDPGSPLASPAHDGDPIIFFQTNTNTAGYCTNRRFFENGNFVFPDGEKCGIIPGRAHHSESPMPLLRWSVTIHGDGTFTASLKLLDNGFPAGEKHFEATLPGTAGTEFIPVIRLRAGSDTGAGMAHPNTDWSFHATDSKLTAFSTSTEPLPPEVRPYFESRVQPPVKPRIPPVSTGFGGMARAVAGHHPAR